MPVSRRGRPEGVPGDLVVNRAGKARSTSRIQSLWWARSLSAKKHVRPTGETLRGTEYLGLTSPLRRNSTPYEGCCQVRPSAAIEGNTSGRIVAHGEKCQRQIRNANSIQCTA